MRTRTIVAAALAILAIGLVAGAGTNAVATPSPEAGVAASAQAPGPEAPGVPGAPDAPGFRCPRCGAECGMPYGRRHGRMGAPRAGAGFGGPAAMRHGRHGRGGGFGRGDGFARGAVPADRLLRGAARLELTDDQISRLEQLSYDARLKLIDLESALDKARLDMRRQMQSGADDVDAMKKHLDRMAKIRVDIQTLRLQNWVDAKGVLTDEQKQEIRDKFPRLGQRL